MTVHHETEPPAVAGIRILMEIPTVTRRFAALRALVSIGAFENLAAGSLTIDELLPDDDSPHFGKDLDIHLLTTLPGGGRTQSEYEQLIVEAGFRQESVIDLFGGESAVVAVPVDDGTS